MKHTLKYLITLTAILLGVIAVGCGGATATPPQTAHSSERDVKGEGDAYIDARRAKLKIIVGDKVLFATLEDNATVRAFLAKLPTTLSMENLYGREMCYRYGAGGLAEAATRNDGYDVGDIIYWPPRGSFVLLYKQNGEEFERVQIGHIDGDISFFDDGNDMEIRFELATE